MEATESIEEEMDVVDDQGQKGEDPLIVSGSKNESQKPRSPQIKLITPSHDMSTPTTPSQSNTTKEH